MAQFQSMTPNYMEQGGCRLVIDGVMIINGKMIVADDAEVNGLTKESDFQVLKEKVDSIVDGNEVAY